MFLRNKNQGQTLVGLLIFIVPLLAVILFAFEICQFCSKSIQVQEVVDEAAKRSSRVHIKGLQFFVVTNGALVSLHVALRTLQISALAGGVPKIILLRLEKGFKKAIKSLAKIQDRSQAVFLSASLVPLIHLEKKYLDKMYVDPKPFKYRIKRTKILGLPGPYELEDDFFEKQTVFIEGVKKYRNIFITKKVKLGLEGKGLSSTLWKSKFLE